MCQRILRCLIDSRAKIGPNKVNVSESSFNLYNGVNDLFRIVFKIINEVVLDASKRNISSFHIEIALLSYLYRLETNKILFLSISKRTLYLFIYNLLNIILY